MEAGSEKMANASIKAPGNKFRRPFAEVIAFAPYFYRSVEEI
jgi:hypothetical protein